MPINPAAPQPTSVEGRFHARIATLERKVETLEKLLAGGAVQVPVVSSLPTAGRKGRQVFNSTDSKLYVDNGTTWTAQT